MSSFPKRKTLLAGSLAFVLGTSLQLPALAAHHEGQKSESSSGSSTEQPMEHQGPKGGTMMDGHEMDDESHEKMMEDMHDKDMDHGDMDRGDKTPLDSENGEYGDDDTEE
ncbi:hypothetical protein [Azotobacter armeniacus]